MLYSGDLGDFASFVAHMKDLAVVSVNLINEETNFVMLPSSKALTYLLLTPATCTMVLVFRMASLLEVLMVTM